MSETFRRNLYALLAALIWGVAFVAQKNNTTGPFTFNAMRSFVAFLFLLPVSVIMSKNKRYVLREEKKSNTRRLWLGGLACGVALGLATFLQQLGMDRGTDAGKASFLTAMYVVLVPILSLAVGKRSPFTVWIGVAVAVAGLFFLCVEADFTVAPHDLWVLSCSLVFAVHIMIIDKLTATCDGVKLSCIQFLFMGVFSFTMALILERDTFDGIPSSLLPALFLGVGSSGIAYTLQILAQKNGNPTVVTVLLCTESVFGALAGAIVLTETMSGREWIGCALILVAILLSQLPIDSFLRQRSRLPSKDDNS